MRRDVDVLHGDVPAEDGMDLPHRRVADRNALNEYVCAAVWLDELGPEVGAFAEESVLHGSLRVCHLHERVAGLQLAGISLLPPTICAAFPWPPVLAIGLAIENAWAGDAD